MPKIDLRAVQIGIINLPHQERRRNRAMAAMAGVGLDFTFIDGVRDDPRHRGCSQSHLKAIETLAGNGPFLVLEDDAVPTLDFFPVIEVPQATDLLYLGHSPYGYDITGTFEAIPEITEGTETPGLLRVHSMLAAHAIVYLTDAIATRVAQSIRGSIAATPPERHDIGLCRIQAQAKVLAVAKPYFAQSAAVQGAKKRERRAEEEEYIAIPRYADTLVSAMQLQRSPVGHLHFARQMAEVRPSA
ncbi:MAG: hypothetical protein ACOH2H_18360 [Cypionkella sp.]